MGSIEMIWWNPATWFGEDPQIKCGYRMLSIYGKPENDPYFFFCEWDDLATTEGSEESRDVTLKRHIEAGLEQLNLLQSEFPKWSKEWMLGEFYKAIWPHVVGYFR